MGKLFSYRNRPVHFGPYPLERLARTDGAADLSRVPPMEELSFYRPGAPDSIVNAMAEYQAMMDAIREGLVKKERAIIPKDPFERANHLKSFGYYCDASQAGTGPLPAEAFLDVPRENPDVSRLAHDLKTKQTKTLASGIDVIMAMLKEAMEAPPVSCKGHGHALVFLYAWPRDPKPGEEGCDWIGDAQAHRACLRATETACTLANYIRLLGYEARAHSAMASDVDLGKLAVAAGLARVNGDGVLEAPFIGTRFGIAAVTTVLEFAHDRPLAAAGPGFAAQAAWWTGQGGQARSALSHDGFARRRYVDGAHPFETLKRVDEPTTFIDEPRVARVPKRADMFARAQFGDMGKALQDGARAGNYVRKSASAFAFRPALGAMVLIQNGEPAKQKVPGWDDAKRNAACLKATCYFLGADAVGLSRCPDWAYYSHDAAGQEIEPYHDNAISLIIDQGHETMEGASGDDWIACAQSMRAYLRFSLLGGVIAQQIRNLGYSARSHTVMDGEVLQPPLLLLSGLGEVSRIGEVILNPFLGPRLKSGVVTTDMPLSHDRPIDFGLQSFCEACNKCARECPSGAITAGPKLMFNGYEIWKSDSQKCTTYRVTTAGGAMCGRCMKTCPWNLEGLFAEKPFRWAAMKFPKAARSLAALDDRMGNGGLNDAKRWWWDQEMVDEGPYGPPEKELNRRDLQPDLDLKYEEQTLAVYPAHLVPPPFPYPFPMDREAGIRAYRELLSADDYRQKLKLGEVETFVHRFTMPDGPPPVFQAVVSKVERMTPEIAKYEFRTLDGVPLPPAAAGAHIDVVVAPEFLRQYSLSGDPADPGCYQIGVLREDAGRGGSVMMHRIFTEGRKVFISPPINHFELEEDAPNSVLMGGGIGVTPLIAMAHRLHATGAAFELHYSCSTRASAGYLDDLADAPWAAQVHYHFSDVGTRAELDTILGAPVDGAHLYVCGGDRYMEAVLEAAARNNWPEEAVHREYFAPPEVPEYVNHEFTLKLARSGRQLVVPADKVATDVLLANGVHVDVKCSDGLCGVCKCGLISGEAEHRDFVLSKAQQAKQIILCQSRAAKKGGVLEIDL